MNVEQDIYWENLIQDFLNKKICRLFMSQLYRIQAVTLLSFYGESFDE